MIDRLLGLDRFSFDSAAQIAFEHALPAWTIALIVLALAALAAWSYTRLDGPRAARVALATIRTTTLLLLLTLALGPQLTERSEIAERDRVVILIDRSASLTIPDATPFQPPTPTTADTTSQQPEPQPTTQPTPTDRTTREQSLRAALDHAAQGLRDIARNRTLTILGFGESPRELALTPATPDANPDATTSPPIDLGDPIDRRSAIAPALDAAAARLAGRPAAGVVIISDGRFSDAPGARALQRLRAAGAPIYTVPLGSRQPLGDIAIRSVEAPRIAFLNDATPITVELDRLGVEQDTPVTVELIDIDTGLTLAQQQLTLPASANTTTNTNTDPTRVVLQASTAQAGEANWRVTVTPDTPDLVADNNTRPLRIDFVDRPIRVLYLDGYPRWEQRYLRNLLIREPTINASTLILAADRRFIQEGNTDVERLPASAEDFAEYDIIILGDITPDVFTSAQLAALREHVASTGAGLILAAGPGPMPERWFTTPIADLLPFLPTANDGTPIPGDVTLFPTANAQRLGVLNLASPGAENTWPQELADPATGWSRLRYAQRLAPSALKPTAQTLAIARPVLGGDASPAVLAMRFGAGMSIYITTDETWRYRFGRGEVLFERFWLQLVRKLGRERLARTGAAANLTAAPDRATVNQPVRVTLDLNDQSLIDAAPPTITVRVTPPDDLAVTLTTTETLTLRPDAIPDPTSDSPTAPRYAALWSPPAPGTFTLDVTDPALLGLGLTDTVTAAWPTDELRRPRTDHAALEALAAPTGGRTLTLADLQNLDTILPNRATRRVVERSEPLWDAPLALILLLTLLTTEWLGRRAIRLI